MQSHINRFSKFLCAMKVYCTKKGREEIVPEYDPDSVGAMKFTSFGCRVPVCGREGREVWSYGCLPPHEKVGVVSELTPPPHNYVSPPSTHTHTHMHAHTHACTHTWTHTHMHAHTHAHTHTE